MEGQFSGRIQWQGTPARGDASISLINATLNDNGTYTCSVRNPPDVHGSPSSHTVLAVTPQGKNKIWLMVLCSLAMWDILYFFLLGEHFMKGPGRNEWNVTDLISAVSTRTSDRVMVNKTELWTNLNPEVRCHQAGSLDASKLTTSLPLPLFQPPAFASLMSQSSLFSSSFPLLLSCSFWSVGWSAPGR